MSSPKSNSYGTVNSIVKAFSILECFSKQEYELTLTQLSTKLSIPKSTVLNLLRTLAACQMVRYIPERKCYIMGSKPLEYSYIYQSSLQIIQRAIPFLEDVQVKTGEIVYLVTHVDGKVLYLQSIFPSRRMSNYSIAGKTNPLHCTGCGKAMLAYLPEEELEMVIQKRGLERRTYNTITDAACLKDELERIRSRGYALDMEEETIGVKCVAMPIRDNMGYPVAAVSISGNAINMDDRLVAEYVELLSRICGILMTIGGESWRSICLPCK